MRIIQVIDELKVGGAEKMFVLISNIIEIDNCILLRKSELDIFLPNKTNVYYVNRKFKFSVISLFKTYKIMSNYDIIHVHSRHNFRYISLVQKLFLMKIHVILHDHFAVQINESIPFGFSTIFKPSYYIGVSEHNIKWYHDKLNKKKNDFILLRNTIYLKTSYEINTTNLNNNIISIGNLRKGKNHLFQLQILKLLVNYNLHIVGKIQDFNYFNALKSEIQKLDLQDKVFFHFNYNDGVQAINEIKPKIAIHTSEFESGPLVLLEYAAFGLPFLSNLTGDISIQFSRAYPELFMENESTALIWIKRLKEIESNYFFYKSGLINYFRENFSNENYKHELLDFYKCIQIKC